MSPVTFKFFSPRGDCRRVTYEETPEFATMNETVNGMVEGRRTLTYRDSEGDIVLLKTSRDVLEAVNDAQDAGVKSIKVRINMVRECPHKNTSKATPANNNNNSNNNRNHCGSSASRRANWRRAGAPQWGRCWSRGLFGQPHHINVDVEGVSNEVEEIIKHFAPFFGINLDTHAAEKEDQTEASGEPASGGENHPSSESEQSKEAEEAAKEVEETPKQAEAAAVTAPAPTIEEATEPVSGSDYTFVENEPEVDPTEEGPAPQREPKKKAEDSAVDEPKPDAIDDKLKLLKEMGFELPKDVARNMIRELNGRMDLIVRALVANQK